MAAGKMRKIILLEANEVPFRVIDHYVKNNSGPLENFLQRSTQFVSECPDEIELDPWISWPTLHRGVNDTHHGILHLGQSLDKADTDYPPIWSLLTRQGVSCGIFGSLHSSHLIDDIDDYAFYLPDFFTHESFAHPKALKPFQDFNLAMTRRSARNVDTGVPTAEAMGFIKSLPSIGVTLGTMATIGRQLANERVSPLMKIRRRSMQPLLGLDVFVNQLKKTQPQFATFYTNHVAANMHRYWAATFPKDENGADVDDAWITQYEGEVDHAMSILEQMIDRLMRFVERNDDYLLVVASSLGQAAIPGEHTKGFHTITDLDKFMSAMGVEAGEYEERYAMVPCRSVMVAPEKADAFANAMDGLMFGNHRLVETVNEAPPLSYDRKENGSFQLYIYFDHYDGPTTGTLGDRPVSFEDVGIGWFEHEDNVACTAHHVPNGALIVYDPRAPLAEPKAREHVPTTAIAPAILKNFEIETPVYMKDNELSLT